MSSTRVELLTRNEDYMTIGIIQVWNSQLSIFVDIFSILNVKMKVSDNYSLVLEMK